MQAIQKDRNTCGIIAKISHCCKKIRLRQNIADLWDGQLKYRREGIHLHPTESEKNMTKTIAKVLLMTLLASATIACATAPTKAPITRKG
jgi:hypothetical protein